jgi:DNA-binding CsgD family transcriptional regulator
MKVAHYGAKQIFVFIIFSVLTSLSLFSQKTIFTANSAISTLNQSKLGFEVAFLEMIDDIQSFSFVSTDEKALFLDQVEAKVQKSNSELYPEICFKIGDFYLLDNNYQKAYYYFYRVLKNEKSLKDPSKKYLARFHEQLGIVYYYFARYQNAEEQLKISLSHPALEPNDKINVLNTLGLIARDLKRWKEAEKYSSDALDLARIQKHEPWIGVISGNLGYIFFSEKKYNKARQLLEIDFEISRKTKQLGSQLSAISLLIEIDLAEKKLTDATEKLSKLKEIMRKYKNTSNQFDFYRVMTNYHKVFGNFKEAFEAYQLHVKFKDSIANSKNLTILQNTEFQIDFEQKQAELALLTEKQKKNDLKLIGLVCFVALVVIGGVVLFVQIQKRRKQEREILELQKLRYEEELGNTEREMIAILSKMSDKNLLIDQLKDEIEFMHSEKEHSNTEEKDKLLDRLQTYTLLTDEDWSNFKKLFEKLNPGFFDFFIENFPEVTNAEVRLAALIKLNLSNLEMARTLGISPDSVRKTNLRLRKKLTIEGLDELTLFIKQI